ncbi:MAG: hypothetical protein ACUVQP_06850 [Bacteroidales bacterium]
MKNKIKPITKPNEIQPPEVLSIAGELEFKEKMTAMYNRKEKVSLSFAHLFKLECYVNDQPEGIKIAKVDVPFIEKYIVIKILFLNKTIFVGYIEI